MNIDANNQKYCKKLNQEYYEKMIKDLLSLNEYKRSVPFVDEGEVKPEATFQERREKMIKDLTALAEFKMVVPFIDA